MKIKQYEKMMGISFATVMIILFQGIFIIYLSQNKIEEYKVLSMIVIDKNKGEVFLSKKEKAIIYNNATLYWNNRKIKYKIVSEEKIEVQNKIKYGVIIKLKFPEKKEQSDIITIAIKNKRISILEMFKNIWGGDKNN